MVDWRINLRMGLDGKFVGQAVHIGASVDSFKKSIIPPGELDNYDFYVSGCVQDKPKKVGGRYIFSMGDYVSLVEKKKR